MKPKIVVIVGPTCSGKSELAVKLAKKFNGEIISVDSRQVYRDLNIGTGKVPGRWHKLNYPSGERSLAKWIVLGNKIFMYKDTPHHLIDEVKPQKIFTVAQYQKRAKKIIRSVTQRGKMPILAGGTGFWIDAVVYGINFPKVPPNIKLRKRLSRKSAQKLLQILRKLDRKRAKIIEQKNPRRLIRAIEIAKKLGKVPTIKRKNPYTALWIGIQLTAQDLKKKIHKRIISQINEGMIDEAKILHKNGLSWRRFYELGLEYKFLADYLTKKRDQKEMTEQLEKAINDYARRQIVWFKKNSEIHWVNSLRDAEDLVQKFLN